MYYVYSVLILPEDTRARVASHEFEYQVVLKCDVSQIKAMFK